MSSLRSLQACLVDDLARSPAQSILIIDRSPAWLRTLRHSGLRAFAWVEDTDSYPDPLRPFLLRGRVDVPMPMRVDVVMVVAPRRVPNESIEGLIAASQRILLLPDESYAHDAWYEVLVRSGFRRELDSPLEYYLGSTAGSFSRASDELAWLAGAQHHLGRRPLDGLAALSAAWANARSGEWERCKQLARIALEADSDCAQAKLLLARACLESGEHERAHALTQDIDASDLEAPHRAVLAGVLAAAGFSSRATALTKALLEAGLLSQPAALEIASRLLRSDAQGALPLLDYLVETSGAGEAMVLRCAAFEALGDDQRCLADGIALWGSAHAGTVQRCVIGAALRTGAWERAQQFGRAILSGDSHDDLVWLTQAFQGFADMASELPRIWERRLDLDEQDLEAAAALARWHLGRGDTAAALPWAEHWAGFDNENVEALETLAHVRWQADYREDAILALTDAVDAFPEDNRLRATLCSMLDVCGRRAEAAQHARDFMARHASAQPPPVLVLNILDRAGEGDRALTWCRSVSASQVLLASQHRNLESAPETYWRWSKRVAAWLKEVAGGVSGMHAWPRITVALYGETDEAVTGLSDQWAPGLEVLQVDDEAWGSALDAVQTPYVLFLRRQDRLAPQAGFLLRRALEETGATALTFDYDHLDRFGTRHAPRFLPVFDRHGLKRLDFVAGAAVVEVACIRDAAATDKDTAPDELVRRCLLELDTKQIQHLPAVLMHRRGRPVVPDPVEPARISAKRRVSVIIPTRDRPARLSACLDALLGADNCCDIEVLIVDNDTVDPEALRIIEGAARDPRVKVVRDPDKFNFSMLCNHGAAAASGEALVFLNNDVVVVDGWADRLTTALFEQDVGAVGAMLRYPDGTIQHAGIVLCPDGQPRLLMRHAGEGSPWAGWRLESEHEVAALTGACLAIRRKTFFDVGGFDPAYALAYGDVDLCLKVRLAGYANVLVPACSLTHHEGVSAELVDGFIDTATAREREEERRLFQLRWGPLGGDDVYHTPNLEPCGTGNLSFEGWRATPRGFGSAGELLIAGEIGTSVKQVHETLAARDAAGGWGVGRPSLGSLEFHDVPLLKARLETCEGLILIACDPLERLVRWGLIMAERLELSLPAPEPGQFLPLFTAVTEALYGDVDAFWQQRAAFFAQLRGVLPARVLVVREEELATDSAALRTLAVMARDVTFAGVGSRAPVHHQWLTEKGCEVLTRALAAEREFYGYP